VGGNGTTKTGKQMLDTVPRIAETFVLAVGNSELKYSAIFMYLFVVFFAVPLNILLNEIILAFCDQEMSVLSVHGVYEG
jgi:hypothetical protein